MNFSSSCHLILRKPNRRMDCLLSLLAAFTVMVAGASPRAAIADQTSADEPRADALEGWRRVGSPAWRFDSTGVEAGPEDVAAYLVSNEDFGDFRLAVEYWVEADTNSGVFVRCGLVADLDDINPDNCYEINIWDEHPNQDYRTGSIVTHVVPRGKVESLGQWNRLEITAEGPSISVSVNGEVTAELERARSAPGPLALQYAGKGLLRFRNFEVEQR